MRKPSCRASSSASKHTGAARHYHELPRLARGRIGIDRGGNWYDDQQPGLGGEFLIELRQAFDRIAGMPESYARLESYTGKHEIRRYLANRFPYVVIYRCRPTETLVVAVSHVRREPLYWLDRLGS